MVGKVGNSYLNEKLIKHVFLPNLKKNLKRIGKAKEKIPQTFDFFDREKKEIPK